MERKKRPWYIWFSIFSFMFLWGDTSRRIKVIRDGNSDLWLRACGNFFKLVLVYIFGSILLAAFVAHLVFGEVARGSIAETQSGLIVTIALYFGSVIATCKHIDWRDKNILHLVKSRRNGINKVNSKQIDLLLQKESENSDGLHMVELQGAGIQSWNDYIRKIEDAFKLPNESQLTIEAYSELMRNVDWFENKRNMLVIRDYKSFLERDPVLKKIIIDGLEHQILPWWTSKAKEHSDDEEARSFNVYLVD